MFFYWSLLVAMSVFSMPVSFKLPKGITKEITSEKPPALIYIEKEAVLSESELFAKIRPIRPDIDSAPVDPQATMPLRRRIVPVNPLDLPAPVPDRQVPDINQGNLELLGPLDRAALGIHSTDKLVTHRKPIKLLPK